MQRIDTEKILQENPIADVIGRYIQLKTSGAHLKGTCPFHDDREASLTVTPSKNLAKCFACGWSGDAIAFVSEFTGKTFHEACEEIDKQAVSEAVNGRKRTVAQAEPKKVWQQRVPPEAITKPIHHYKHGTASMVWTYRLDDGRPYGYVCRFDLEDGTKEVLPYTWCTYGNRSEWRWQGFDTPRPLYNLHLLAANPNASVLLVEGEKTADAAQAQLDPTKTVVTTWPGGSMAIEHIHWLPIHGRKVIMWPDNDVQGISAMLHVRHKIGANLPLCKIIPLDTTLPKGWDCADSDWKEGELRSFVLSRLVDDIPPTHGNLWRMAQIDRASVYEFGSVDGRWLFKELKQEPPTNPEPPADVFEPPTYESHDESFKPPHGGYDPIGYSEHFYFLGWSKSEGVMQHHFFQLEAKSTLSYSPSALSKSALISLAPLSFWEMHFGGKKGIIMDAAQEFLIRTSIKAGPFNERFIRGRGAWTDKERVIIHTGSELIVDGTLLPLGSIESRFVYETSDDLGIDTDSPLSTKEAHRLIEVLGYLNWERDVNTHLLAGWCVVAPFCGALKWRPHIWLTGSAGTGKSWVFEKIVRRALGETALAVQGETSEAGLRQTLVHDALPVVFDEMDSDGKRSEERIQNILTLMRSASTDDGGLLLKGSATGAARSYSIRSCFAFASIGVQAAQQSDRSRITILSMKALPRESPERAQRWETLQRLYNDVFTDAFVQRLQARTVALLPTILKNAKTFANAAAAVLGEQRQGDQLGAILAGAYSIHSDGLIEFEAAKRWVADKDWSEEKSLEGSKDEHALVAFILDQIIQVEGEHAKITRTIGELVAVASNRKGEYGLSSENANSHLKRFGLKVEVEQYTTNGNLVVSNSSEQLRKMLRESAWAKNHARILLRIPGAADKTSARFASGAITRAVSIPLDEIIGTEQ